MHITGVRMLRGRLEISILMQMKAKCRIRRSEEVILLSRSLDNLAMLRNVGFILAI